MGTIARTALERGMLRRGHDAVIGVDEVGMGCLAGPVIVCAVLLRDSSYDDLGAIEGVSDSKLLTPRRREALARKLTTSPAVAFALAAVHPRTIDRINIFQAARRGMRRSIAKVLAGAGANNAMVLVDGPHRIAGLHHEQRAIVKGDRDVFAIACASIIAKVHRDAMMVRYAQRFPQYGFEIHKGYGTALHRECIARCGPSPIHRRSFAGVLTDANL